MAGRPSSGTGAGTVCAGGVAVDAAVVPSVPRRYGGSDGGAGDATVPRSGHDPDRPTKVSLT
ncbi:hypothetical protein GCM10025868_03990 [Angustibacter aerolatus]|uniref:Uncharacterized protein n=1 Tax=Angustibacter aerolatus TaxID=1162965 RepID=A0ABQ6JCI3_9ACTN|nr:hypothetical protein GCM10025868_03990 [Angustibacter aerolatus]